MVCVQILMLVLIANAQYCIYGLPYLFVSITQLLIIAYSHGRSDQDIRVASSWFTTILLIYMPIDLLGHYWVHFDQESQRIDDEFDSKYFDEPSNYRLEGYQGIMITTPSYVTFGLKIALFILENLKYKFSYDMGPVFKKLKDAYMEAESTALPESKMISTLQKNGQEEAKLDNGIPRPLPVSAESLLRQKYNQRLKFQYIKIFKKSSSFVHKILQPISLFMVCLVQLIFVLGHPSILFIVLFGLSVTGFFVSLKEQQ